MSLRLNLRAVVGRAYPRLIGANREPSWVFYETFLPVLSTAAYVYIYKALDAPKEFVGFVVIGGVMTAYWMNVLWSMAAQLYWEKEVGNLQLYMIAPMSKMALLAGMAIGGLFTTSTRALIILTAGIYIFNVDVKVSSLISLLLVFFLTLVALYGLGMLFSSLYLLWGREAWHLSNLLQEPVYLVSGFYFPVSKLGFSLALAASILPTTLGLDGMRQILFPGAETWRLLTVDTEIKILAILTIVFILLAKYALDHVEKIARGEGRLIMRWQ